MRLTEEDYAQLKNRLKKMPVEDAPKQSKYRNVKIEYNGLTFDSKKELRRYQDLLAQQYAGQIWMLNRQTEYRFEINGQLICSYIADFSYYRGKGDHRELIIEDVKSAFTRKLPVYSIKKKLMKALYDAEIQEI